MDEKPSLRYSREGRLSSFKGYHDQQSRLEIRSYGDATLVLLAAICKGQVADSAAYAAAAYDNASPTRFSPIPPVAAGVPRYFTSSATQKKCVAV